MSELEDSGWQFRTRPRSRKDCKPIQLVNPLPQENRVVYAKGLDISRSYLLCLLGHEAVLALGNEEIKHGEKAEYYNNLLGIKKTEAAMQDDSLALLDAPPGPPAIEDIPFEDDGPEDDVSGDGASWSSLEDDIDQLEVKLNVRSEWGEFFMATRWQSLFQISSCDKAGIFWI